VVAEEDNQQEIQALYIFKLFNFFFLIRQMVKLRLRRRGRKARPIYDIVAMDSRKRRDGQHLEVVGQYNPITQPSTLTVDNSRALYWLKVGAQPTDTVRHLLSAKGVLLQLHLERKGVSAQEIQAALDKHTATVEQRVQRMLNKKTAKQSKKKVEAVKAAAEAAAQAKAAAEAPAPAAEAPAEAAAE
jgi:small subunit ribosomal protein S16